MRIKLGKEKLIPIGIAAVLAAGVIAGVKAYATPDADTGYRVVCLGDSILGNVRDETSVTSVMEKELGYQVFNGCFGGTCASLSNPTHRRTFYEDSMNLVSIVDSIVRGDYSIQYYDIAANNYKLPYFYDAMKDFEDVDFDKAEIIFLEHGVNDYSAGRPLDNKDDPYDTYTYGGALRYSIKELSKAFPKAKIVLVTPTYCYFVDYMGEWAGDCTTENYGYGVLEDYVDLQLSIAGEFGLDIIDDYHNIGINADTAKTYTMDGIHLNEEGRELLARTLAKFTKEALN
ncbi:MAG: hypothetical protein J5537_07895 [Lachnospiraceae bacterium]|nr:hypothetical protein [Lachnospiraceae bacterium]